MTLLLYGIPCLHSQALEENMLCWLSHRAVFSTNDVLLFELKDYTFNYQLIV